jgi:protein involved in polysaccharide export with SLBB domain
LETADFGESIKPLPLAPIPDDPPPHEGAMIDLPIIIEPPDLLLVEALEALPGRPISGERLVRPDGSISLGFYGDLHVQGLTLAQAKEKIIKHLRKFIPDEVLGLYEVTGGEPVLPLPAIPPLPSGVPPEEGEKGKDEGKAPKSSRRTSESGVMSTGRATGTTRIRRASQPSNEGPKPLTAPPAESKELPQVFTPLHEGDHRVEIPAGGGVKITIEVLGGSIPATTPAVKEPEAPDKNPFAVPPDATNLVPVRPVDSSRVFVDLTAYNSKSYYVQGDVANPGKLPWTGRETVLDALNYAGGFIPTADPKNIRLVRPARAGKPARVYKVDHEAITERGEAATNYQLFPGDRLVVGRHPVVKATIVVDRVAAPLQTAINSILQQSFAIRSLMQAATSTTPGGVPALKPEQREALVKAWADFWWQVASRPEGAVLDEKTFREALMKALNPPEVEKPEPEKK